MSTKRHWPNDPCIPLTKEFLRAYRRECAAYPETMTPFRMDEVLRGVMDDALRDRAPQKVWRSRKFLVQLYSHENGNVRLSIQRCEIDPARSQFKDGITWEQIQQIKSECGFADRWAVEVFPPDDQIVNVANMRHVWLLDEAPVYGWQCDGGEDAA